MKKKGSARQQDLWLLYERLLPTYARRVLRDDQQQRAPTTHMHLRARYKAGDWNVLVESRCVVRRADNDSSEKYLTE